MSTRRNFSTDRPCLYNLPPKSHFARSQQSILPRIPPQKMIRLCMRGVVLARLPDFMQQKRARPLNRTMQIVAQAAFFFAGRRNQCSQFGFQHQVLAVARPQNYRKRHRLFWQLSAISRFPAAQCCFLPATCPFLFLLGHDGGDCTPTAPIGKWNSHWT